MFHKFVQDYMEEILGIVGVLCLLIVCGSIMFADSPTGKRYIEDFIEDKDDDQRE